MPGGGLRRALWLAALLAPALALMTAFVVVPLGSALAYSLFSWNGLARGDFAGLENFRLVLFQPPFSDWTRRALLHNLLVFAGLTAYDTQRIKEMYLEADDSETMGKKAIMGALSLYLDFINLFLMLLRLLGNRE